MTRKPHDQSGAGVILANAQLIRTMHEKIHALARWNKPEGRDLHAAACREFHAGYDILAFPGGLGAALALLRAGDPTHIDTALTFLELRPYFFRSQYIRSKLLRFVKRATLTVEQKQRLEAVFAMQAQWKIIKRQRMNHE